MKIAYLVQGTADLLNRLEPPRGAPAYALVYDRSATVKWADRQVFDANCTWTVGRNKLADMALADHPDADYLVFSDDDVAFDGVSFDDFDTAIRESRPDFATPVTGKTVRFTSVDHASEFERPTVIDEQIVVVGRRLFGQEGLVPLVCDYDHISWYVACLIFEYLLLSDPSLKLAQFNRIRAWNTHHRDGMSDSLYNSGTPRGAFRAFRKYLDGRGIRYDSAVLHHLKENQSFVARQKGQLVRMMRSRRPRTVLARR